jgi:hypothetical protein
MKLMFFFLSFRFFRKKKQPFPSPPLSRTRKRKAEKGREAHRRFVSSSGAALYLEKKIPTCTCCPLRAIRPVPNLLPCL